MTDPEDILKSHPCQAWDDPWGTGWDDKYALLHARAHSGKGVTPGGDAALGAWTSTQRHAKKRGALTPEREAALAALPGWSWEPIKESWDEQYGRLRAYAEQHQRPPPYGRSPLGVWVGNQRRAQKKGRMSPKRVAALEAVPFWCWDATAAAWDDNYARLLSYAAKHQKMPTKPASLGVWVSNQRQAKRLGKTDPERDAALEEVPFWSWDPYGAAWDDKFARLRAYLAGHQKHPPHRSVLGTWVASQRASKRRGAIRPDREAALDACPGWRW